METSNKRILFVDDETMALTGLRRALWAMTDEWELEFVSSGEEALKRLEERSFEVVVSDMHMPRMNGAELLNEVMKRHPQTIRLILSGYADREMILKCIGSTHQYLSKPCDVKALRNTLRRAVRLQESMENDIIRQLVTNCANLPTVPVLYSKIVETLQDAEVTVEAIGTILAQDPALTAKILQTANSTFFGLGHEISTPGEAVTYLGTDSIKSLILFNDIFSHPQHLEIDGFTLERTAEHSQAVADLARLIADLEDQDRKIVDESYLAGLLHDVGKLVFAANLPIGYKNSLGLARAENLDSAESEHRVFKADHSDVGSYLLALWGLPTPVVEAIALHHKPGKCLDKSFSPLTTVHIADVIIANQQPTIPGVRGPRADLAYLRDLNLLNKMRDYENAWLEHLGKKNMAESP